MAEVEPTAVVPVEQGPDDQGYEKQIVVACNPGEIEMARIEMAEWAEKKADEIIGELGTLKADLEAAKKNRWRVTGLETAVRTARARVTYYQKMAAACHAGYYMIPNIPYAVFAVRTAVRKPTATATRYGSWAPDAPDATAQLLPQGEGRYVARKTHSTSWAVPAPTKEQPDRALMYAKQTDFRELEWPMSLARIQVMEATSKAMALKLFDEIGVVSDGRAEIPTRKGDPIVLGVIKGPRVGYQQKRATFMICWFMERRAL